MSTDAYDLKNIEQEQEKESILRSKPALYYDCGTCGSYHERGDGCEWKTHPSPPQCSRCHDTGILNPGWAVMAFVDEPCPCENSRCRECFNLLALDEDPCQRCGALTRESNTIRVIPPELAA